MATHALASLFEELAFGVAIVDRDCRLLHATRAARMQLQARRGLMLSDGVVDAELENDRAALHRTVESAAAGLRGYQAFGREGVRIDVAVLPVNGDGNGAAAAALVFEKCAGSGGLGLYFFSQAYRLTRAEQSVLTELCDGAAVVEAAENLGISVHTARTHVRNILVKTAQPNLRGLVRRIGMLPPVGTRFAAAHAQDWATRGRLAPKAEIPPVPAPAGAGENVALC